MIMIRSIVRPEKVDNVLAALMEAGFPGVTKMSVVGRGKQRGIKIGDGETGEETAESSADAPAEAVTESSLSFCRLPAISAELAASMAYAIGGLKRRESCSHGCANGANCRLLRNYM